MATYGVDFSRWQSRVNPQKLIDFGIAFAIIKCGEVWIHRLGAPATDDAMFDYNMPALDKSGLPCGSYYYYHPSAGNSKQLRHFESLWNRYPQDFPPVLDIEDTDGFGQYEVQRQVKVMLDGMEEISGRIPIIYTRNGFWVNQVGNPSWSDKYSFWLAQYPKLTNRSVKNIIMHQFDDKFKVPGCPTMDGNYWLGTKEELFDLTNKKIDIKEIKKIKRNVFALPRANRRLWEQA
jgi:GH25 family lysozyme M1 (1,4-beta-N-acetylmuramidase)